MLIISIVDCFVLATLSFSSVRNVYKIDGYDFCQLVFLTVSVIVMLGSQSNSTLIMLRAIYIWGGSQITFASLGGWVVKNLEKLQTL